MTDLRELYQSLILDHNRSPRNFREMDGATGRAEGRNPLCGDHVAVWVRIEGDRIADVSFTGSGCAISKASASAMTSAVKGKTVEEAERLFEWFRGMVTGESGARGQGLGNAGGALPSREAPRSFAESRVPSPESRAADSESRAPSADLRVVESRIPRSELRALQAFAGVAQFPIRVKCATLAWHALHAAVAGGDTREVTTEVTAE